MKAHCRFFALLTLLPAFLGCTNATPPPIEIGHVSDKTRLDKAGDQAEFGMRLALHELQNDDALAQTFGGRKLQIRHTDTRGKLDAFEAQAVRLDSVNRCVALLGGLANAETAALSNAKVPLLTFHGQPSSNAGNHVIYLGMSPSRQGAALAKVVAEDAMTSRIVILIDERGVEATVLSESFRKALEAARHDAKADPVAVQVLRFAKDAKWNELIERMNSLELQVAVFAGSVHDFNAWRKVLRREFVGEQPHLLYAGSDGDHRLFDLEGDATTPVELATSFYADPKSDKIAAFTKAFREAFQTEPDVHAALAYDGTRMLVEAMKQKPKELTPEKLREELLKTTIDGLTGPLTITTDREVTRPLFVVRWQNGKLTAVKTIAP